MTYTSIYKKNGSPKAREIVRLAEMLLRQPEATSDGPTRRFATDAFVATRTAGWKSGCHSIDIWQRGSCRVLVKMMDIPNHGGPDSQGSVVTFYDKRSSSMLLAAIHELLPLEALAYYGRD